MFSVATSELVDEGDGGLIEVDDNVVSGGLAGGEIGGEGVAV